MKRKCLGTVQERVSPINWGGKITTHKGKIGQEESIKATHEGKNSKPSTERKKKKGVTKNPDRERGSGQKRETRSATEGKERLDKKGEGWLDFL